MTLSQRVDAFKATFPKVPASWPWLTREQGRDVLYAVWVIGNNYRNKTQFYGRYPPSFLPRVLALFPGVSAGHVMHVFSGSLPAGDYARCDLVEPAEYRCTVYDLPARARDTVSGRTFTWQLLLADPPYSKVDATKYGTPMIDRRRALAALADVTSPRPSRVARHRVADALKTAVGHRRADPRAAVDESPRAAAVAVRTRGGHRVIPLQLITTSTEPQRLIRVFPRRTKATPDDVLAYVGPPDMLAEADEVHVSVTFKEDRLIAERLAEQWRHVAAVKVGGVAYDDDSLTFIPGRYIRPGYTITSRGCPRRCWFCGVWKKWPTVNQMPIYDGWNVLDDNLLAAPEPHVRAVFAMLQRVSRELGRWVRANGRPPDRVEFTGGLEALALQDYQVDLLANLRPRPNCFFAYDPGDAFETLESAGRRLLAAGFTRGSHRLRCYVLVGFPKDTFDAATERLTAIASVGFTPMAMLWRPETPSQEKHRPAPEWRAFQRRWVRPAIIHSRVA